MPDVFGLRAFDSESLITQMLPGQFRNEFRVLIPDQGVALEAFHDIVITDLSTTPEWRTSRLVPSDVTSLRQRWLRILFRTMHKRQEEMEKLRRSCRDRPEMEFRQGHPGYCPQCKEYVAIALDRHMMDNHLEFFPPWTVPRDFWLAALVPWLWTSHSFMIRDADWCTSIGFTVIPFLIRR